MASVVEGRVPPLGGLRGVCKALCGHARCRLWKQVAWDVCRACKGIIGFDRPYTWSRATGRRHVACPTGEEVRQGTLFDPDELYGSGRDE